MAENKMVEVFLGRAGSTSFYVAKMSPEDALKLYEMQALPVTPANKAAEADFIKKAGREFATYNLRFMDADKVPQMRRGEVVNIDSLNQTLLVPAGRLVKTMPEVERDLLSNIRGTQPGGLAAIR